jgi:putative component of membrane protein insertase Oxa1/YidC/SpoIIIJ protein YidD
MLNVQFTHGRFESAHAEIAMKILGPPQWLLSLLQLSSLLQRSLSPCFGPGSDFAPSPAFFHYIALAAQSIILLVSSHIWRIGNCRVAVERWDEATTRRC